MATSAPASPTWPGSPAPPNVAANPVSSPSRPPSSESPEPNCAICLGKVNNACVTDVCRHRYCFQCLLEWSKVKAECPLCKASFRHITHTIESDRPFEKYKVPTPPPPRILPDVHLIREEVGTLVNDFREFRDEISRSIVSLTLPSSLSMRLPEHRVRMSVGPLWRRRRGPASSEFRCDVYRRRLRVEPGSVMAMGALSGRARECTPTWYRSHPAHTHKLVPWLNRELNALLSTQQQNIGPVSHIIMEEILRSDIRSQDFHDRLLPYLGNRTEHFQHEFYHFASSNYDLIGYDMHATYTEHPEPSARGQVNENDSSDDEVIFVEEVQSSRSAPLTEPFLPDRIRLETPNLLLSAFTSAIASPELSLDGPSTSHSLAATARTTPEVIDVSDVERSPEIISIISDDDDDDDLLAALTNSQSETTELKETKVEVSMSDDESLNWESILTPIRPKRDCQKRPAWSFLSSSSSEDSDHSEECRRKKKWKGKGTGKNSGGGGVVVDGSAARPHPRKSRKRTERASPESQASTSQVLGPDSDDEPLTARFSARPRRARRTEETLEDGLGRGPAERDSNAVFEHDADSDAEDPADFDNAPPSRLAQDIDSSTPYAWAGRGGDVDSQSSADDETKSEEQKVNCSIVSMSVGSNV